MKKMCSERKAQPRRPELSKTRNRKQSYGYDPVKAEAAALSNDWSEDSDENWMPQEYLADPWEWFFPDSDLY